MSNRSGFTRLTGLPGWYRADDDGLHRLSVCDAVVWSHGGVRRAGMADCAVVGVVIGLSCDRSVAWGKDMRDDAVDLWSICPWCDNLVAW